MNDIEKRARELLAAEYERFDLPGTAAVVRNGEYDLNPSMRALVAALMPPDGYVLVPLLITDEMVVEFAEAWFSKTRPIDDCEMQDAWAAALAARPEVP